MLPYRALSAPDGIQAGRRPVVPGVDGVRVRRGAKALLRSEEQVLLVKERREDGSTFWTLPGGGVEPGESLKGCLRRELIEELLCCPSIGPPVAQCLYRHRTMSDTVTLYSVFAGEPVAEPTPRLEEGVVACGWYSPTDLPEGLLPPFRRVLLADTEYTVVYRD